MLRTRAFSALNLNQYFQINKPDNVGNLKLNIPNERQYVLRLLIKRMFGEYQIPEKFGWILPLVEMADSHQKKIGIVQPFVYLTIRNGLVNTTTDDVWHVDGFSQTITHLPEQNYIWSNIEPTEYVEKSFKFPKDFDGLVHNIHNFFQNRIKESDVLKMDCETVYGLDPYVVHRRPSNTNGKNRCFVRLSYTPIEIEDVNNTYNHLIPTNYKRDGIKEMRNKLINYDKI